MSHIVGTMGRRNGKGFRRIWTASISHIPPYVREASSVATRSLRWTALWWGCRKTGWQPAFLRAIQLLGYCRFWPLTRDRWIQGRLQKCVHLCVRHTYVGLVSFGSVWSLPRLSATRGSLLPARSLGMLLLPRRAADQWCLYHQRISGSGLTYRSSLS